MNAHLPGSTIGILGGGQLGRMLSMAAADMGYHVHIFCPEPNCPAAEISAQCTVADYTDIAALEKFAAGVDVVTLEFENISLIALQTVQKHVPAYPSATALNICQHRLREKDFLRGLGIGTAPYATVRSLHELEQAPAIIGYPSVLKTTELGYDGKGQVKIETGALAKDAWAQLNTKEAVLEKFIHFEMEISVIIARNAKGETAVYTPVRNIHKQHILYQTIAPADISNEIKAEAISIAENITQALELVGILAVEMFVGEDGRLLVNELAPRPHNSGHWTMDACVTGQFEQTIRAVCGLPLGGTEPFCNAVMTNLLGDDVHNAKEYLAQKNTKLHLYGKAQAREGRKMGHVTELKL